MKRKMSPMFHFWCPVPVQVRTDTQTYHETYRGFFLENETVRCLIEAGLIHHSSICDQSQERQVAGLGSQDHIFHTEQIGSLLGCGSICMLAVTATLRLQATSTRPIRRCLDRSRWMQHSPIRIHSGLFDGFWYSHTPKALHLSHT